MGRHCGFEFYKLVDGKFVDADVVHEWLEENSKMCNWLNIDGRCEATTIFLNLVSSKESPKANSFLLRQEMKPEEKYIAYLLLNHPELDGFERFRKNGYIAGESEGWLSKYFYFSLDDFRKEFDFEQAQKAHDNLIKDYKNDIKNDLKEIESLRKHQESAQTKAAFDGFEESINDIKDGISETRNIINELEVDDYGYIHFMCIKKYLDIVEQLIKEDKDLIVVAYAND